MNKAASTITLLLLWVLAAGCESESTPARVRLRVFEIPTQTLQLHTSGQNPYKLSDSAYSVSIISPTDLQAMLRSAGATQGVLTDTTRVVNGWPAVTDAWVYSPSYVGAGPDTLYTGGGAGCLGVRERGGHLELHLDYLVNHRGPQGQRLIESKIFYEYRYPEGGVLLFHTPADVSGQGNRQHVLAFEVTRDHPAPLYAAPDGQGQSTDVLAYR